MKRANRKKLVCSKLIRGKVIDAFTVIVLSEIADDAKKNYESQGYIVTVI